MSKKEKNLIEQKLKQIIFERLEINPQIIGLNTKLRDDLGIDSFGYVEMIFEIKDKFGVEIKDEDAKSLVKLGDIVEYLFANLKKR